jgi:amino acid adenylation domain-containing protein
LISFEKTEIEGTLGARISRLAGIIPGNTAVCAADGSLSFAELDRLSNELASRIIARRGPSPEPVALLLDQGAGSILAMFGIMQAGKSAVVLAPDFPVNRLREIWTDADKPLIVTEPKYQRLADEITGGSGGRLDLHSPPEGTNAPSPAPIGPDPAAQLLYTSGTTGEPKGVVTSHRVLLHTAWDHFHRYRCTEDDRAVLIASHGFGASVVQSIYTLLDGVTLHLVTGNQLGIDRLTDYLRREAITILVLPSFALLQQQSAGMTERIFLPDLRLVMIGGGELRREDLQRFREFFPKDVEFSFRMASSEALTISEMRIAPETQLIWEKIPVGRMINDKELLLLDENRQPVAPGETGEIAIRSRYLADGYWRRPEMTSAKFLADPDGGSRRICLTGDMGRLLPDGLLEHAGRKDNLVRVRGFSVQLDMVGRALEGLPGVKEAAAAAIPFSDGGNRLIGYVVASGQDKPAVQSLRNGLAAVLPPQMIPASFVFLESLPRTVSDRLDRQALPPPGTGRPDLITPFAAPRNEFEKTLCALWAEIIRLDRVGIDDDFFLLGGDSLLAMHMVLRVEEKMKRRTPSAFFRKPTIRQLTELWTAEAGSSNSPAAVAEDPTSGSGSRSRRKGAGKQPRFRRRYQSRNTIVGPRSIRLQKRIPRLAVELATLQLSYPQGIRWISGWCGSPSVLRTFYPAETGLFHRWVESLGGCPDSPADALNACVLNNILWSTRFKRTIHYLEDESFLESMRRSSARFHRDLARIIAESPAEALERFFHAEGMELVQEALRQGRGVILVSYHGAVNRFANAVLPVRLGLPTIPTLSLSHGMKLTRRNATGSKPAVNEKAIMANVAIEGLRILKQGGVVQIAPDIGYDAADGVPLDIGRYHFLVRPGFAELAMAADAAVIPWFSTRRISGRIDMRFYPPLDPGAPSADPSARTADMLRQYGAFVENTWKLAPESLLWEVIDTHMNRPLAER